MRIADQRRRLGDFARAVRLARELAGRERWPRERLASFQQQRLEELVRDARERSPFWRARLPSGRVRLAELPTLDKAQLMESFDDLVADRRLRRAELLAHLEGAEGDELYLGEYRVLATSGSSGRKGLYVYGREGWIGILAQFLRYSDWVGNRPRLPRLRVAAVGGASPTHMTQRVAASVDVGLHRIAPLAVTLPLPKLVAELNRFGPDVVNAYPSAAALLAEEQLAGRLNLRLERMSTSSEPLTPQVRRRIEAAFGVQPFDLYGTTEGLWGCECDAHAGVHLFDDMCVVENVDDDGRPVDRGEPGARLLVTNLFNRVQPLIRFEITDVAAVEPDPCPCGRTLLRLRSLEGRAADVIRLGGVAVHPMQFGVITTDPDVREFQVVQQGERLTVRVVLGAEASAAPTRLRETMTAQLRKVGVARPLVRVEAVDHLERSPAGKLQIVVADGNACRPG